MTASARHVRRSTRRTLGASTALLADLAVGVSLIEGTPGRLPGIALGSAVLLHGERALAADRRRDRRAQRAGAGRRGRPPIELSTSSVRYEAEAADVAQLQERLDELVAIGDVLADRLDARQRHP